MTNLEALSFCNVKKVKIPQALKRLPNLVYLDCFGCGYKNIPVNLLNARLKGIGIECDNATQLKKICGIKRIQEIYLTRSELEELPAEIGNLKSLKILCLWGTQISSIPETMQNLRQIRHLDINDTPLANSIPEEIIGQTAKELIAYICKQQKESVPYYFNESKMIVVGQGNVGKSCLVERITNNTYEDKESTEGIDVKRWTYNYKKKNYTLHIWDFGGQEIYHSTHQFFLTKRSLYIFVWDARAEEEYGRIDYWLKTIESFAHESPIIIAINKCDEKTTRVNRIDLKEYKEKYPQIKNILDISCKDNLHIRRLIGLIKEEASRLKITKVRWLKSWYDVRREIEEHSKTKPYISVEEYQNLCEKYLIDREEAKSLSKYLHDLGIILHYQDDSYLNNIVILSPEWATTAVYKILDSQENVLRNRNGLLYLTDLPKIWKDKQTYPEEKYIFLLKIMEKFELCYKVNEDSYLIAELLENTSIDCPEEWDFSRESCICIMYKYDFMPAGVMTRFIVKTHKYIANKNGKNMCWRKGVYLQYKTAYAQVIMKDSISEKKIEVRVNKKGNPIHIRELLFSIRENLKEINATFNKIKVEEFVPCNCDKSCRFQFPYSRLCSALASKVDTIQCYESFKQVNVLNLLEGIEMMNEGKNTPYSKSIEVSPTISPIITTNVSIETNSMQMNILQFKEIKNIVMEMQGDIAELTDDIEHEVDSKNAEMLKSKFEKINQDLECIGNMTTTEEVVKSGKLNKLKRFLKDFNDEKSDLRKSIGGAGKILTMLGDMMIKFNALAKKLGIELLPI